MVGPIPGESNLQIYIYIYITKLNQAKSLRVYNSNIVF